MKLEHLILLPKSEYVIPATGKTVIANQYWLVTENDEIIYYTTNDGIYVTAHTNKDKRVCEVILENYTYPMKVSIKQIPMVFETSRDNFSYWKKAYQNFNATKSIG